MNYINNEKRRGIGIEKAASCFYNPKSRDCELFIFKSNEDYGDL